uniref:Cyclin-dependent kinase 20 n=1 Tax=Taeniopygia guttata TaxID=59729 RepID=A0A674GN38_TAEGU
MEQYMVLGRIGEGAHGVVYRAKHRQTGELVALKKVPLRRPEEGLPLQTLREIKALREMEAHPNVIRLRAAFAQGPAVVLALELLVADLGGLLRAAPAPLPPARVRALLAMTLRGLGHLHGQRLLHRDLKPANLLLDSAGRLKLADFGLARLLSPTPGRPYSHQVATRWYRAPELLYGARRYDEGVDLWAAGCILGELITLAPLFPGDTDLEQLCRVLSALGTPRARDWPVLGELGGTGGTGGDWGGLGGTGRDWEGTGRDWEWTGRDWEGLGGTGRDWEWTGRDWEGLGGTGRDWGGLGGTGNGLGGTGRDWEGLGGTGRDWEWTGRDWEGLGGTGRDWGGLGGTGREREQPETKLGALGGTGRDWGGLGGTGSTGSTGLHCPALVHTGLYWPALVYTGPYWSTAAHTDL